jgi:hypothetical protein
MALFCHAVDYLTECWIAAGTEKGLHPLTLSVLWCVYRNNLLLFCAANNDFILTAWDPAVIGRILRLVTIKLSMWNEIDLS